MNKMSAITAQNSAAMDVDSPFLSNPKDKLFADAYLSGKSATQAAIDAGWSMRTAGVTGAKKLKALDVANYITWHNAQRTEQALTTRDKVIRELTDMAMFDPRRVITTDEDGDLQVDFANASDADYKAITKVKNKTRYLYDNKGRKVGEEKQTEVGFADKYRGLELLGRIEGLFKEPEQRVVVDVADRLLRARNRAVMLGSSGEILENSSGRDGITSDDEPGGWGAGV